MRPAGAHAAAVALLLLGGVAAHAVAQADVAAQADVVEDVRARVVLIDAVFEGGAEEQGAGFILGTEARSVLLVTAAHVIQDRRGGRATSMEITVSWDRGEPVRGATVLDMDDRLDVAILELPAPHLAQALTAQPLLCHRDARAGERVTTIGHRLGDLWVVNPADRVLSDRLGADTRRFTTTSSGIAQGSSGGPVLGEEGCLLGIVTDRDATEARILGIRQVLALLAVRGMEASLLGGESPLDRRRRQDTFQTAGRALNRYLFTLESIPALLRRSKLDGDELRQTVAAYNDAYGVVYNGRADAASTIGDHFGARRGTEYLALVGRLDAVHKTIVYSKLNDIVTALRVSGRLSNSEARDLRRTIGEMESALPPLREATDEFLAQLQPLVSTLISR